MRPVFRWKKIWTNNTIIFLGYLYVNCYCKQLLMEEISKIFMDNTFMYCIHTLGVSATLCMYVTLNMICTYSYILLRITEKNL